MPLAQTRARKHSSPHSGETPLRRAAPGENEYRLSAALRLSRSDSRSLRGALRTPRADRGDARIPPRPRAPGGAPRGALEIQAPAGRAGPESHVEILRHGP